MIATGVLGTLATRTAAGFSADLGGGDFDAVSCGAGGSIDLGEFLRIVELSLTVSVSATAVAALFGLPAGAALAIYQFPGRRMLVILVNALFGLPPVVVGLMLFLALSRSGPFGFLHALFTPTAMVAAQAILATPIIIALTHRAAERAWARYGDALRIDGAARMRAMPHILAVARAEVMTAVLAGFGRTISEVGAIILVGGNIRGLTRTMTTAIALQTSEGYLSLAIGLGAVLVGVSVAVSGAAFSLAGNARDAGQDEER